MNRAGKPQDQVVLQHFDDIANLHDSADRFMCATEPIVPRCCVGRRKPRSDIVSNVQNARKLAQSSAGLRIPAETIERERAQMSPLRFGRTHSRSLLGPLTEFTRLAWFDFKTRPDVSLDVIAGELAEVPLILPLEGEHACEVTRRLFG